MTETAIEKVRRLDALTAQYDEIDGWMRDMRLGSKPGTYRKVGFLPGGFGFGWFKRDQFEPFPCEVSRSFYDFLSGRLKALEDQIRTLRIELDQT